MTLEEAKDLYRIALMLLTGHKIEHSKYIIEKKGIQYIITLKEES